MIREAVEWLLTPSTRAGRNLGYLNEAIAIGARHRRCRAAWAEHLARSRQAILSAARKAPGHRTALVLGSGPLLDVPLAELAAQFRSLILVDALHPLTARLRALRYSNVELVTADLTGALEPLHRWRPGEPLPAPQTLPLLQRDDVDFVVSQNLLSQLGVLPVEWIEKRAGPPGPAMAEAYAADLTRAHLADLARCRARVCLIADVECWWQEPDGRIAERSSSIYEVPPPPAAEEWIWAIAPAPEGDPRLSEYRRVIVALDPGKTDQSGG
ncbi:MAG: hypothetical protein FJX55_04905 [Alphaproteobacteria bacterium]|nr:hypothetical protein [Alphaproteobacteria bacterium]